MSIKLWPYQTELVDQVRQHFLSGEKKVLLQAPTGSGKTAIMANMAKTAESQGMTTWFIVHRRELIKQSLLAFANEGIDAGVVCSGWPIKWGAKTQICSVGSLGSRASRLRRPNLICLDEVHHICASSWTKIYKTYEDVFMIGLTATPERLDGRGLGDYFKKMVLGPSVTSLIDQGYLSPYKLYAPPGISLTGVRTKMGDYVKSDLNQAVDKPLITGDAIKEYLKLASGKRAVVFCSSIQHSLHVVEQFNLSGIGAEHVDGETSIKDRDSAIQRFSRGETKVLSNVDLFGEGFDLPAIECAILLRPTKSLGLYLQQVGRVLRIYPGKDAALILDHAGNCERHGLPDEERQWSLDGHLHRSRGSVNEVRIKVCPKCFAAQKVGSVSCSYCGYAYPITAQKITEVAGDLTEVDVARVKRNKAWEESQAKTLEDWERLGESRGYARWKQWALIQWNLRHGNVLNRRG